MTILSLDTRKNLGFSTMTYIDHGLLSEGPRAASRPCFLEYKTREPTYWGSPSCRLGQAMVGNASRAVPWWLLPELPSGPHPQEGHLLHPQPGVDFPEREAGTLAGCDHASNRSLSSRSLFPTVADPETAGKLAARQEERWNRGQRGRGLALSCLPPPTAQACVGGNIRAGRPGIRA